MRKSKLTKDDVELIREVYGEPIKGPKGFNISPYKGVSTYSLAKKFDVHPTTIGHIITFHTWR